MVEIKPETKVYSVDEITICIKNLIEQNENLQNIWIKGEISNFRNSSKAHMYFNLKDESSILGCAMFQRANQYLEFIPEDGMKVLIRGSLEVYKPRGTYQIIIEEMHLAGKGELYLKFLQIKAKLEKEGLFKEEHKRPIPKYPQIIGVVTSTEGSVIHDIIKVVKRRYPHIKLVIFPSAVQGDDAKYGITQGIRILNQLFVDVIIVARGGGSFEDLWPFNEEIVAREIFNSKIPIVSAIGHETDYTIADFVADKRAPTPSVASELVVPNEIEIYDSLDNLQNRLCMELKNTLRSYKKQVSNVKDRSFFRRPMSLIEETKQRLDEMSLNLIKISRDNIRILKIKLKGSTEKLDALSPFSVLKRGYSITIKEGKVISSIKNIKSGDTISTIVKDGEICSTIKNKNEKEIF